MSDCSTCGSPNATIKASVRTRKDGSKAWRYICSACKKQQNSKYREQGYLSPPRFVTNINWSEEERNAWNKRAAESRRRISARFSRNLNPIG